MNIKPRVVPVLGITHYQQSRMLRRGVAHPKQGGGRSHVEQHNPDQGDTRDAELANQPGRENVANNAECTAHKGPGGVVGGTPAIQGAAL